MLILPVTEYDLEFVCEVRNNSAEFLHDNRQFTYEDVKVWFKNLPPEHKYYTIREEVHDGNRLGYPVERFIPIGYFRTKIITDKIIEIGADLHPHFRGRGLAKTAYIQLLKELKIKRFTSAILEVLGDNVRAYCLYRRLGFEVTYTSDHERDGRLVPNIHMRKVL